MKITFYGAVGQVTGSCTLLEGASTKLLVDCGAFQGIREAAQKNIEKLEFDAASLTAVFVTHAHYDHCGRLPVVAAAGFDGPIYMTPATRDLVELVLRDALRVMEFNYTEKGALPFFNLAQLEKMLDQIETVDYEKPLVFSDDCHVVFHDAGHILGSATIEIGLDGKTAVFSGDLGNINSPIIDETVYPVKADIVVMEATYATRLHEPIDHRHSKLLEALRETVVNNGVLLIPAFAIERTQEVLWELHNFADKHRLPNIDFYLDSPLALKVGEVFSKYTKDYDKDASREVQSGHDFMSFPNLKLCPTGDDSRAINKAPNPKVIIAGSGMMDGGRILFHLERYLPNDNTTVLVVGYQGEGTIGRRILNGESPVRIHEHMVDVRAKIVKVDSYSAHADNAKLEEWVSGIQPPPKYVFLNHGEDETREAFADSLNKDYGLNVIVPKEAKEYILELE